MGQDILNSFYLTLIQGFVVMGLGFAAMSIGRTVSVGLVAVAIWVCLQVMLSKQIPAINIAYSLTGQVPAWAEMTPIMIRCALISIFCWGMGQAWLRPR